MTCPRRRGWVRGAHNRVLGMTDAVEPAPSDSSLRLTDAISLGVLAEVIGRDLIEDILDEAGRREQRTRRLPAHVMVRFCLAMCLFYDDDYEEVMRKLVGSLKEMDSWRDGWQVPTTSAITQARQRLTEEPLRMLFERTAAPVAGRGTKRRVAWRTAAHGGRRVHARRARHHRQRRGVRPFGHRPESQRVSTGSGPRAERMRVPRHRRRYVRAVPGRRTRAADRHPRCLHPGHAGHRRPELLQLRPVATSPRHRS